MQGNELRRYILLRPAAGQGAGVARLERRRGRTWVHIRARQLPQGAVRALLICGGQTGAVTDLGLMQGTGEGHVSLSRENLMVQGQMTALALASDWPMGEVLMYGWVHPGCTLWQLQEAVARYLACPAPGSAPAPATCPENPPKAPVLRLRGRVPT